MNIYTFDISRMLKITMELAFAIQNEMEMSGFDFSEATDAQLKREAKLVLRMMQS